MRKDAAMGLRIVYLLPRKVYETKMSRGARFKVMEAVEAIGAHVEWYGPGWKGFREDWSLTKNLQRGGRVLPDLIHCYQAGGVSGVAECPVPKSITFNAAHSPRHVREAEAIGASLIFIHHPVDRPIFARLEAKGVRVIDIQHAADPKLFANKLKIEDRPIGCLLAGKVDRSTYPLRKRFAKLIESGLLHGAIRPYSGDRLANVKACDRQYADYANELGKAKVALVCSSKYRYPLAKYVEALMAGCVVVGDVPAFNDYRASQAIFEIEPQLPDDRIVLEINRLLDDPALMQRLSDRGRAYALACCSTEVYAAHFVHEVRRFLAKRAKCA